MKRFALIGCPVGGSLSPALFQAAYGGRRGVCDLVENAVFEACWNRFLDDYDGINVTAPFKEQAFRRVDTLDDGARRAGAVNLAVKTPSGIAGYNTDCDGVALAVKEVWTPRPGLRALVVGCGGAGRAAAVAAKDMGLEVSLMNRTGSRAVALARELGMEPVPMENFPEAVRRSALVVYTVPVPIGAIAALSAEELAGTVVLEANYRSPAFRPEAVREAGGTYVSGRRWLLYQAVAGYRIFTGEDPDIAAMEAVIEK